jgi:hypothetical protein
LGQKQFPLHSGSSSEAQALADIFRLKIRVFAQNLMLCHSAREQSKHGSHGNPQMAQTGHSAHLAWINRNALEILHWVLAAIVSATALSCNHA